MKYFHPVWAEFYKVMPFFADKIDSEFSVRSTADDDCPHGTSGVEEMIDRSQGKRAPRLPNLFPGRKGHPNVRQFIFARMRVEPLSDEFQINEGVMG